MITAEIYWAFKCIYGNFALGFCDGMNSRFSNMFPDNNVENSFSMWKDKLSYVINFGIALYIRDMLIENVKQSTFFPLVLMKVLTKLCKSVRWTLLFDIGTM